MPVFSYRAINGEGKEVRGSMESANEETARKALEDLHMEVLEVNEPSRTRPPTAPVSAPVASVPTFAFEGQDAAGAVRRGTIQAGSKREAFDKLRNDQKLTLKMLAPMGSLPRYNDPELLEWQKSPGTPATASMPVIPFQAPIPQAPQIPRPKPTIGFTNIAPATPATAPKPKAAAPVKQEKPEYHPLSATLRLYAGWLLAWYGLFVAIGYYTFSRTLPWDIPFVQAFYVSPLIFSFTVAIFLFLGLSAVNKAIHGRLIGGTVLAILGIGLFVAVRMNV